MSSWIQVGALPQHFEKIILLHGTYSHALIFWSVHFVLIVTFIPDFVVLIILDQQMIDWWLLSSALFLWGLIFADFKIGLVHVVLNSRSGNLYVQC